MLSTCNRLHALSTYALFSSEPLRTMNRQDIAKMPSKCPTVFREGWVSGFWSSCHLHPRPNISLKICKRQRHPIRTPDDRYHDPSFVSKTGNTAIKSKQTSDCFLFLSAHEPQSVSPAWIAADFMKRNNEAEHKWTRIIERNTWARGERNRADGVCPEHFNSTE